jgi:hypothetical protein
MIREALVNDAALFVGWKTKGVLRTRPVARRCHHLFDGLPLDKGSAHEPRKNRFQQPPRPRAARASELTDNVTAFAVSSTAPSTMAPSPIVVPKVWLLAACPFANFGCSAFSSTQFQKASLSFRRGSKPSSAARIADGFEFETS